MTKAHRWRILFWLVIAASVWVCPRPAGAADADELLKKKEAEVQRLQEELRRAQSELNQLRHENERLRRQQPPASGPIRAPVSPVKPSPPLAGLPPLKPGDLVELSDLIGHFQADPAAAARRYSKRVVRVCGQVARFDTKLILRNYDVVLECPSPGITVVCSFNYIDKYASVYTKQRGKILAARRGPAELPLHQVGDTVTVQGKCQGLKDGELRFTECQVVK